MGCLNGYSTTCGNSNSAGIQGLKLVDLSEVSSITESSDQISAITLTMSSLWYEYDFQEDTAGWTETKVEGKKAIWNQTVELVWERMDNTQRAELMAMVDCNCGIAAAVYDNNGLIWIVGGGLSSTGVVNAQGLYLNGNEGGSGKNLESDENIQTIVLAGRQRFKAKLYTDTWASLSTS